MATLTVNGKTLETSAETLAQLLTELDLSGKPLVAEVNGIIVPLDDAEATPLAQGAVIELVRFVGGG